MTNINSRLYGDACLYYGLRAFVNPEFVDLTLSCVGEDGKLWRNPTEAKSGFSKYAHGTSRDMLAGALLAFLKSKDTTKLELFCSYVKKHKSLGEGDLRTQLRPGNWSDIARVLDQHGLSVRKHIGLWGLFCYKAFGWLKPFEDLATLMTPVSVIKGYQLHLVLASMFLRKGTGGEYGWLWSKSLKLLDYCLPNNAMVKYLMKDSAWLEFELPHMYNRANHVSTEPIVWPWAETNFELARVHLDTFAVDFMADMLQDLNA